MSSLPSIPLPNFSTWTWRGWYLTRMVQHLKRGSQHHPFLKRYETVIVMQMQNDLRVSKWFCHGNETYPLLWPQGTVLLCHWTLCKTEHNFWVPCTWVVWQDLQSRTNTRLVPGSWVCKYFPLKPSVTLVPSVNNFSLAVFKYFERSV